MSGLDQIKQARAKRQSSLKELQAQVESHAASLDALSRHGKHLEEKLARFVATLRETVEAGNNAAILLSCVERHLDDVAPGWDDGAREQLEQRVDMMRRRADISARFLNQEHGVGEAPTDEERLAAVHELWGLAGRLGSRAADLPLCLGLLLKAGEVNRALDLVEEVRRDKLELPAQIQEMVRALVERCAAVAAEQSNDVAEARARSMKD